MTTTQRKPAERRDRQPHGADQLGIIWHPLPGGRWLGTRNPYTFQIDPDGRGSDPFSSYRVAVRHRGGGKTLAVTDARTVTLARSWIATQLKSLDARDAAASGGVRAPPHPVKTTFEVAIHRDSLDATEVAARLTRRMHAEAKRLGLVNPRRVSTIVDTSSKCRPAEVWACRGDPR